MPVVFRTIARTKENYHISEHVMEGSRLVNRPTALSSTAFHLTWNGSLTGLLKDSPNKGRDTCSHADIPATLRLFYISIWLHPKRGHLQKASVHWSMRHKDRSRPCQTLSFCLFAVKFFVANKFTFSHEKCSSKRGGNPGPWFKIF